MAQRNILVGNGMAVVECAIFLKAAGVYKNGLPFVDDSIVSSVVYIQRSFANPAASPAHNAHEIGDRARELEAALQWLKNAGLVHLIEFVQNAEIPLSANAGATYFKVYLLDIGLLGRRLSLGYKSILLDDGTLSTYKGAITENYVLNELVNQQRKPYFWRSGNSAELDFLFESDGKIVPVEVKVAVNTQAKSYKQFCKKYSPQTGYKVSFKNLAVNDCEGCATVNLPLYLLWNMRQFGLAF